MSHNVSVLRLLQCPVTFNLVKLNITPLNYSRLPSILAVCRPDHHLLYYEEQWLEWAW